MSACRCSSTMRPCWGASCKRSGCQRMTCPAVVDTGLSTHPGLEGIRAYVSQRAVAALAVVIGFDVFKYGFTHLGAVTGSRAVTSYW